MRDIPELTIAELELIAGGVHPDNGGCIPEPIILDPFPFPVCPLFPGELTNV